jgi:hypothetical protein
MEVEPNDGEFTPEQMSAIYAKIEVSKMLVKMSIDMASQVEADIKFYRMINNVGN